MSKECWCGCTDLIKYSEFYSVCTNCHTLVSNVELTNDIYKIKDEEHDLYGKSYWEENMVKLSGLNSMEDIIDNYLKDRAVYWLKYLLKYILPNTSIAEIGCGLGQFPYLIKSCGYQQTAYEVSPEICEYVRKNLKVNILCDDIGHSKASYDGVVAYDLLEHMLEPDHLLTDISGSLKPDGILCFQTPCYDNSMSYDEMCKQKPRFKSLMIQNEHVFLYSRESIEKLLKSHGFTYINFEPAYFGDDYDMFVFASRTPMKINSDQEINEALNQIDNGRIIKALISLFDEKKNLLQRLNSIEDDATKRLESIEILTKQLKEVQDDSTLRLKNNNELTQHLQTSEKDRAERLVVINNQQKEIEQLKLEKEDLLKQYNKMKSKYDSPKNDKNDIKLTVKKIKRLILRK